MWHRVIDCLGLAVGVTCTVPELDQRLAAVLRTYGDAASSAAIEYRLEVAEWPLLVRDGRIVGRHDEVLDLIAAFELDLYRELTARVPGLLLHAAAVVGASGSALVFAGPSGAGKSTLIRSLLARGYRYLTEECVALMDDSRCLGLARALNIEDESLVTPEGFVCDEYLVRRTGGIHRMRLFHPPARSIWRGAARAAAIVAIDHGPDATDSLQPLTSGAALAALWPAVFRTDLAAALDAAAGLSAVPRFALRTRTPERALAHALALATELSVAPA